MTPRLKKTIFVVVGLAALFVIYAIFVKPDPTGQAILGNRAGAGTVTNQNAQVLGSQISQALLKIEQIKLDRNVFQNPVFNSLADRSEPIVDEPVGRTNPFAPIGDVSITTGVRTELGIENSTSSTIRATSTVRASTSTKPN